MRKTRPDRSVVAKIASPVADRDRGPLSAAILRSEGYS